MDKDFLLGAPIITCFSFFMSGMVFATFMFTILLMGIIDLLISIILIISVAISIYILRLFYKVYFGLVKRCVK